MTPATRHRLDHHGVGAREIRRGPRADFEQRGRLAGDDLEVVVEAHRRIVAEAPLHDLAFGERDARLGRPGDELGVEAAADLEGAAEEEIARDEGLTDAELVSRRRAPAAHVVAVDDVVVQQARGVDELAGDRDVHRVSHHVAAAGAEHQQGHRRPDALAAAADQVIGDLGEARFARREQAGEALLDEAQLIADQGGDRGQRRGRGSRAGRHADTPRCGRRLMNARIMSGCRGVSR